MGRLRSVMHAHVALSALILGLAATASAHRLRGRANMELLAGSPGPLPQISGFEPASHRRSLRDTSEIQQKVVAALRTSAAKSSNAQLAAAQALADAAIRSDGTTPPPPIAALTVAAPTAAVPQSAKVTTASASGGALSVATVSAAAALAVPSPHKYKWGGVKGQVGLQYLPMQGNPKVVRSGMYYLPSGYKTSVLPVVVVFHGLAGNGSTALAQNWVPLAEQYKFIVIAPECADPSDWVSWQVAKAASPPTLDQEHALAALLWVSTLPGVTVDSKHVAAVGISDGGAPAVATGTRYLQFTHAMTLHGKYSVPQLGSNTVPIWMSTGTVDPIMKVGMQEAIVASVAAEAPQFPPVVFRTYPTAHDLYDMDEQNDALHWFLGLENDAAGATTVIN